MSHRRGVRQNFSLEADVVFPEIVQCGNECEPLDLNLAEVL